MGSKVRSTGPGGVPWAVIVPVVHAAVDVVTSASCPSCGTRVVLYAAQAVARSCGLIGATTGPPEHVEEV